MRKELVSVFLASFLLQGQAASQPGNTAQISLEVKDVTVEYVLNEIEAMSNYHFLYNHKLINVDRKVSLSVNEKDIDSVLSVLFQGTDITYQMNGEQIVLSRNSLINRENTLYGSIDSQQQTKIVTGIITDKTGEPVIGANIVVKGTTNGTISGMDGRFSLEVPDNAVLQVSYIGYLTRDIIVNNQKEISVRMVEDTQSLEEVVVVGYGTQKKGEVASAISSIKSENFIKTPSADPAQMIKGQVPGLTITTPDANPTSTSEISLRGITTLKASAAPLVLIDGIPGDLNSVSPDDIQQIDVLKDGSAAAIYGTRGTNGVILITTKNVQGEMPTEVDVNAYISTQQIVKTLPFMDAAEMRQRVAEGVPGAQDDGANTDWLDEVTRTPFTQIYNISLRGGSKNTNYVASFEYRGLNGLIKRTNNPPYV